VSIRSSADIFVAGAARECRVHLIRNLI